mmetsp:Transcript_18119/g.42322  ORF Transcript_18119/g.42322 Transcript_18119/m.42322 type:complete len:635 (+) Transcript_18119:3-1907(+)
MQFAIAGALELIAWSEENKKMIISAGGCRVLSNMLSKGPQELKAKAATAMCHLAVLREGREHMAKDGTIDALIKMMFSKNELVQLEGMRTLEAALRWPRNQKLLIRHGGLRPVVDLLGTGLTKGAKAKAAGIIQCLTAVPANHADIVRVGALKPLADLMEDGNQEAQVKAMGAICAIAVDPTYHINVYRAGALVLIVPWLERGNIDGRAAAAAAVASLAKEPSYCKEMVDEGAVPKLTDLIGAEGCTNESNAKACKALSAVAISTGCRAEIAKVGVIPRIIALLTDGELEVKEEAALCTWTLALDDMCRMIIEQEGGIGSLLSILDIEIPRPQKMDESESESDEEDFSDVFGEEEDTASQDTDPEEEEYYRQDGMLMQSKGYVAGALATIALSPESRIAIGRAGGVRRLVRLLVEGNNTARAKAAGALSNLAADPNLRVEIGEAGAILPLVRLLDLNSDLECRAKAKACIWNLALDAGNRTAIASAGAIRPLVALLHRGEDEPRAKTAGTLWNLAVSTECQVAIVKAGAVRPLVDLLANSFLEDARVCSAGALWNLALSAEGRTEIRNSGGVEALLGVVRRCSGVAQATAAGALRNLAADPRSQQTISSAGALPGLDQSGKTSGIEARLMRMTP